MGPAYSPRKEERPGKVDEDRQGTQQNAPKRGTNAALRHREW